MNSYLGFPLPDLYRPVGGLGSHADGLSPAIGLTYAKGIWSYDGGATRISKLFAVQKYGDGFDMSPAAANSE